MMSHGQKYLKKTKISPLKLTGNRGGKGAILDLLLKKKHVKTLTCRHVDLSLMQTCRKPFIWGSINLKLVGDYEHTFCFFYHLGNADLCSRRKSGMGLGECLNLRNFFFSVCKATLKALYLTRREKRCLCTELPRENALSLSLHCTQVIFHFCFLQGAHKHSYPKR